MAMFWLCFHPENGGFRTDLAPRHLDELQLLAQEQRLREQKAFAPSAARGLAASGHDWLNPRSSLWLMSEVCKVYACLYCLLLFVFILCCLVIFSSPRVWRFISLIRDSLHSKCVCLERYTLVYSWKWCCHVYIVDCPGTFWWSCMITAWTSFFANESKD